MHLPRLVSLTSGGTAKGVGVQRVIFTLGISLHSKRHHCMIKSIMIWGCGVEFGDAGDATGRLVGAALDIIAWRYFYSLLSQRADGL